MNKIKEYLISIGWSIKLALRINAGVFLGWGLFSILLAILPAVALSYNRQAVSILSAFLLSGHGSFHDAVRSILVLGVILTAVGLSKRINGNFLYFVMYDAYYFGLEEYMMDVFQSIEIKTLMDKKYKDDFWAASNRCGSLADFMSSGTLFLSKLAGAVSLLVVAYQVSPVIFLIASTYIAAVLTLNFLSADKIRWDSRPYGEASRLSNYYQSSVMTPGVAKELRVYGLSKETISKWDKAYDKVEQIDRKYVRIRQLVACISGAGFYVFMAGMMAYCIGRVADGGMSVDVFLMLYAMGQSISEVTQVLSSSFQETDRGLFFLNIQRKFVNSVPKTAEDWKEGFQPADEEVVFHADSVCFSYDDEKEVLHDLSFSIKKGETIALVGVNGSGKTTLVKLLIGLFSPAKGNLRFYGKPYDPQTRGAVIQRVGMFFQDFHIFHATLRENVGFGDLKNLGNTDRILLAMQKGGADKLPSRFPKGMEQWLLRNVIKDGAMLSGGEKQRVAVSRAHMSDKEILIFDEPAAALDPIAEMKQFHAIREKIAGRTAILISHRVGFARLADRIFVLDGGYLTESGTHEELISKSGIYAGLFREQAQWYETEGGE
ncbi:ATP-binding cassette subfamily B protein [Anaerotaenia torta]|uniref:ABC transporter ATP-binding protein n=1 Tax=Anaerotaenia torta TaxID=433293 RepID=UPI003D23B38C